MYLFGNKIHIVSKKKSITDLQMIVRNFTLYETSHTTETPAVTSKITVPTIPNKYKTNLPIVFRNKRN